MGNSVPPSSQDGPHLPPAKICKALHILRQTFYHWINTYKESGNVLAKSSSGRPKITSMKENSMVENLSLSNPEATLGEITEQVNATCITASKSTIRKILITSGLEYRHPM